METKSRGTVGGGDTETKRVLAYKGSGNHGRPNRESKRGKSVITEKKLVQM